MLFGRRKDVARKGLFGKGAGRRPWRLSAKLLIASSIATVIGFSTICASVMLDMRRGEEELARQTLENLASGIDADISRNIEVYDLSLRNVSHHDARCAARGSGASMISSICSKLSTNSGSFCLFRYSRNAP